MNAPTRRLAWPLSRRRIWRTSLSPDLGWHSQDIRYHLGTRLRLPVHASDEEDDSDGSDDDEIVGWMTLAETSEGLEELARRGIVTSDENDVDGEKDENGHEISGIVDDRYPQSDWDVR
jgi:hypothetical protein